MSKAWTWWSICILTLIESEILHHSIQVAPSSAVASKDLEMKITSNHNVYKFTIPGSQESRKYTAACQLGLSYTENLSTETNSQFVQDPILKHGPRPDKIPWGCLPHGCMNKCDLWSVLMSRPSPGHSQLTNMELVRYRPRCVYIYIYTRQRLVFFNWIIRMSSSIISLYSLIWDFFGILRQSQI